MKFAIAVLLLSVAAVALAQDLPEAPSRIGHTPVSAGSTPPKNRGTVVFHKKVFWPLVVACGTAAAFDAQLSHADLVSHPNHQEAQAWLLGPRPSLGRYYVTFAVMDGGAALISYKLLHSRRKPIRVLGWGLLGGLTAIHIDDDIEMAVK